MIKDKKLVEIVRKEGNGYLILNYLATHNINKCYTQRIQFESGNCNVYLATKRLTKAGLIVATYKDRKHILSLTPKGNYVYSELNKIYLKIYGSKHKNKIR